MLVRQVVASSGLGALQRKLAERRAVERPATPSTTTTTPAAAAAAQVGCGTAVKRLFVFHEKHPSFNSNLRTSGQEKHPSFNSKLRTSGFWDVCAQFRALNAIGDAGADLFLVQFHRAWPPGEVQKTMLHAHVLQHATLHAGLYATFHPILHAPFGGHAPNRICDAAWFGTCAGWQG